MISGADVTVGPLTGHVGVYAASTVGCTARLPNCTAAKLPPGRFGFMGEGLDGQGFSAILGIDLAGAAADNPLRALGVRRWIVRLPQSAGQTGVLILDPSVAEPKASPGWRSKDRSAGAGMAPMMAWTVAWKVRTPSLASAARCCSTPARRA